MKVSNTYKEIIRGFEGKKLDSKGFHIAYNKGDKNTIGYGNTFYENGDTVKIGDRISENRARELFFNVLESFARSVYNLLKKSVSQNQFDSLVSLAYNIGIPSFKASTLLKKANINPNDATIKSEFTKWVFATLNGVKTKLDGLETRRKLEASNYFTGSTKNGLIITIIIIIITFFILKTSK